MDFLLWAARSLHIFSIVVWLGGLTYQAAVLLPAAGASRADVGPEISHSLQRFVPIGWLSIWTVLVTGVALMLFNPRFVFLQFQDRWSIALGLKQLTFALMVVFSFGAARMIVHMDRLPTTDRSGPLHDTPLVFRRLTQFNQLNVGLGIAALLLAAAMK